MLKTSKVVYSEAFRDYSLTDTQLQLLHNTLFDMLLDIKKVCDANHITFLLSGGTMLGAIRHKGFIPWDDDVDIMMLRSEYLRFRNVFIESTGDKYDLVEPLEPFYTNKKPKVFLKKSVYKEVVCSGLPDRFSRVFLDIFLIEDVPASPVLRWFVGKVFDFAFLASSLAADYKYPSPLMLEKCQSNKELKNYYYFRRYLGAFFDHFFGMRFYIWITTKLSHVDTETGWVAIPTGVRYNREVFKKTMFTDLITVSFNGVDFCIPRNYDLYLRNLYKDYMQIPNETDRLVHSTSEFKLL